MFSVYSKAGRIYRGAMEGLRHVGPLARTARAQRIAPLGQDGQEPIASLFADPFAQEPIDPAHRTALAAYAQTVNPGLPRQPLTTVDSVMSQPVTTVADSCTVEEAWQVLANNQLGQAPVIDAAKVLVGLISRADLMAPERLPGPDSHALVWQALLLQSVVDVMWSPVPSVALGTDIRRVARVLLDTGLPGLPVVDDDGRVTGFVSRSDILRAVVGDPPLDLWV